jgi:hypothetical protein
MNEPSEAIQKERDRFVRALRASTYCRKAEKATLDEAILALACVAEATADAQSLLANADYTESQRRALLEVLPSVREKVQDEAAEFPSVTTDAALTRILNGSLKDYLDGNLSSTEALARVLPPIPSTRSWVQKAALYFSNLHGLGIKFYKAGNGGASDFVGGQCEKTFRNSLRYLCEHSDIRPLACRHWERSPLGAIEREHGVMAARLTAATLLAEAGMVGVGPIRVRELAWTVSPAVSLFYHRSLSRVRRQVEDLVVQGLLECPDTGNEVRLYSYTVAHKDLADQFWDYVRDADPIGPNELKELEAVGIDPWNSE